MTETIANIEEQLKSLMREAEAAVAAAADVAAVEDIRVRYLTSLEERVEFLQEAVGGLPNVEVDVFSELVVEFARRWQAKAIVKGLRVISDFEWETQMNQLNRHLAPEIETVYVMASPAVSFVSSSGVKEIAAFGGKVDELVPETVARRLAEKFPNGRPGAPENPRE